MSHSRTSELLLSFKLQPATRMALWLPRAFCSSPQRPARTTHKSTFRHLSYTPQWERVVLLGCVFKTLKNSLRLWPKKTHKWFPEKPWDRSTFTPFTPRASCDVAVLFCEWDETDKGGYSHGFLALLSRSIKGSQKMEKSGSEEWKYLKVCLFSRHSWENINSVFGNKPDTFLSLFSNRSASWKCVS